jgi:hypothetical protein
MNQGWKGASSPTEVPASDPDLLEVADPNISWQLSGEGT